MNSDVKTKANSKYELQKLLNHAGCISVGQLAGMAHACADEIPRREASNFMASLGVTGWGGYRELRRELRVMLRETGRLLHHLKLAFRQGQKVNGGCGDPATARLIDHHRLRFNALLGVLAYARAWAADARPAGSRAEALLQQLASAVRDVRDMKDGRLPASKLQLEEADARLDRLVDAAIARAEV